MTKTALRQRLNSGRISKDQRDFLMKNTLMHPTLVETLWEEALIEDKNNTFNASWVLDNVLRKDLRLILPYLDKFCSALSHLKSESVIRPVAHICEMLVLCYFKKKKPDCLAHLNITHLNTITEACFDWLIGPYKMAPKVFAMTSLYYLGEKFDWVRSELQLVLESTITNGSVGYRNRAMKTLALLKKTQTKAHI